MLHTSQNHEEQHSFDCRRLPHRLQTLPQTGEDVPGHHTTCRALSIAINGVGRCLLTVKQNAKHRSDMFMNDAYQRVRLQLSLEVGHQPD